MSSQYPVVAAFPGPAAGGGIMRASEFAGRPLVPRPWLLADMIPARQVTTLDGDGGGGKTTLALQLCAAAVTGRAFLGQPVARGPTIYLSAEDDLDELQRRLKSICVELGVDFEDLADLHLWPLAHTDPALVVSGRDDALDQTERWRELETAVARIKPTAIVLDSRADVFAGNEINRNQARGFIGMLRSLAITHEVAVIVLAHPSLTGMASGTGNSGSTHWRNAVRSALYLQRPTESGDLADPNSRTLTVMKANYGPTGRVLKLRWSAGAFVLEGDSDTGGTFDRKAAMDRIDAAFLQLLDTYAAQGRRVSDQPGSNYAPSVFAKDPSADGATKAGFTAAMNRLFAAGIILVETVGPASKSRRQLVRIGSRDGE